MRIDPAHLAEFKDWMRAELAAQVPVSLADMAEIRAFIRMMKTEQWKIIADAADRAESDVIGQIAFSEDELMELDDYEQPFYEKFLRERHTR